MHQNTVNQSGNRHLHRVRKDTLNQTTKICFLIHNNTSKQGKLSNVGPLKTITVSLGLQFFIKFNIVKLMVQNSRKWLKHGCYGCLMYKVTSLDVLFGSTKCPLHTRWLLTFTWGKEKQQLFTFEKAVTMGCLVFRLAWLISHGQVIGKTGRNPSTSWKACWDCGKHSVSDSASLLILWYLSQVYVSISPLWAIQYISELDCSTIGVFAIMELMIQDNMKLN